jgi:protein-tyrosine-phosphatase
VADDLPSILFVCGRNAVRSPLAGALARAILPDRCTIASAGVTAGEADAFVSAVLAEIGLDLADHRPTAIDDLEDLDFDLVVTLSPQAHHRALELTRTHPFEVEYWPTPDPTLAIGSREQILAAYRELRELLSARIRARLVPPNDGAGESGN